MVRDPAQATPVVDEADSVERAVLLDENAVAGASPPVVPDAPPSAPPDGRPPATSQQPPAAAPPGTCTLPAAHAIDAAMARSDAGDAEADLDLAACWRLLEQPYPERVALAEENSWPRRIGTIMDHIERALAERRPRAPEAAP